MIKKIIPFMFALLFIACNNSSELSERDNDTIEEIEEPYIDPMKQEIVSAFPPDYQFFSQQDSMFNASRFEQIAEDTVNTPALKVSDKLQDYYPLFIYNTDSSYAIDLYSYNILLEKRKGKIIVQDSGPDTEVALIDLKNKTGKRIYFGGSSSAVLDAKWINNQEFLLLTGEVLSGTKFQPRVLKYNLADNSIANFVYPDTLNVKIADYRDKRLETIN